ncbi:MAG: hypothetical protein SXQ77_09615 [Halobacteria archaeon]|nr:hypothetical protein [Halobacteria archaeon]
MTTTLDDQTVRDHLDEIWDETVEEWERESDLDAADLELVEQLELIGGFEFFWDEEFDRVGYEAPSIPKDWKTKDYAENVRSWGQVSKINMAINDLGMKARTRIEEDLGLTD